MALGKAPGGHWEGDREWPWEWPWGGDTATGCHQPGRGLCSRSLEPAGPNPGGHRGLLERDLIPFLGFNSTPREHRERVGFAEQVQPGPWASKVKPGLKPQPWSIPGRDPALVPPLQSRVFSQVSGQGVGTQWDLLGGSRAMAGPGRRGNCGLIPVACPTRDTHIPLSAASS